IALPSLSPTSRARIWSQPPMAPCPATRLLSARRKWTLFPDPLLMRSASEGPPSSAKAEGSSTPYEIFSSFSLAAMPRPITSALILTPTLGWPGLQPYHSRYLTRHPRGNTAPSPVVKPSSPTAHHPTEKGDADPQSIERNRSHSGGI